MEDSFLLLGQQENPFPYYLHADISATLSYYEGLCGAVNEAKVMGRPVIATRFSGIGEQLVDGVNGSIVDNNEDAIYTGMRRLLTDADLRARLANDILPETIRDDEYKLAVLEHMLGAGDGETA
jgi:glycosyltransferase involved in cell wall biosynthesis